MAVAPSGVCTHQKTCERMFMTIRAKNWKQLKCPSAGKYVNKYDIVIQWNTKQQFFLKAYSQHTQHGLFDEQSQTQKRMHMDGYIHIKFKVNTNRNQKMKLKAKIIKRDGLVGGQDCKEGNGKDGN